MASSCCGTKKQKMNGHYSTCNGNSNHTNGYANGHHSNGNGHGIDSSVVAIPEMCHFCFEVLFCELNNMPPPQEPSFTNDA